MKRSEAVLVKGDIRKTLLKLTLPMMTGFVAMIIFNTADMIYVGRLGGDELAAISFTFPVAMLFVGIAQGLGVGAASVVARAIGAEDLKRGRKVTAYTIFLALVVSAAVSTTGLLTIEPLFKLMGAEKDILPLIRDYMEIWYIGMVFVMVPMIGNNIIRATGDAKTPMYIMLIAALLNIVLDPFLIFGIGPFPRLELAGAAAATVISRATTMVVTLKVLKKLRMIEFSVGQWEELKKSWISVLHVGAPAALTNLLVPISLGILTYLSSLHGKEAVAALGVGSRIDFIALLPMFGLGASLLPFVGQNMGAGKKGRIRKALHLSFRFSFYWGFGVTIFAGFFSDYIGLAFTSEKEILDNLKFYLLIIPVSYSFQGLIRLSTGYFNAVGKPFPAAFLNFLRFLILLIPFSAMGNLVYGFVGILGGVSLSGIVPGVLALRWTKKEMDI